VVIATTTGRASLDRAALAMVRRSAPFPVIPAELPDELEIVLPVNFLVIDPDTNRVAR
jgi:TonB family protein